MARRIAAALLVVGCSSPSEAPRGWVGPVPTLRNVGQPPSEWIETASEPQAVLLEHQPATQRFAATGTWELTFDPVLRTPRAIRGTGRLTDLRLATQAAYDHAELFGTNELTYAGALVDPTLTTVQYTQSYRGLPVIGAHLGMTIAHDRLVLVQGVTYPIEMLDPAPTVLREDAIATARGAIEPRPVTGDRDDARLVVLPMRAPGSVRYHLAWEITAWRGLFHAIAYVDAHDRSLVMAYDADRYDYQGAATMEVDARTVGDPIIKLPAQFMRVRSPAGIATTGADGTFAFRGGSAVHGGAAIATTVSATLQGAYVDIHDMSGPEAQYFGVMSEQRVHGLAWDARQSTPADPGLARGVNETNRFVATVFPNVPWIARPVLANVNLQYTCNAFWNGVSINFFHEGGGCNDSGRIFDVIAHEWGHGLDQHMPGGALDGGLGEFIGDLISFVQTKSPLLGPGFFKDGEAVRDLDDPDYQCYDPRKTEVHAAGHVLGTVVFDIFQDLEAAGVTGEQLKRLMLLPIAIAQTRSQWYSAMLAVDDDDGNLANGTPHECLIYKQFVAHSCGGTRWPGIPKQDPPGC